MQRTSAIGYRGGIRIGYHQSRSHPLREKHNFNDQLNSSISNLDDHFDLEDEDRTPSDRLASTQCSNIRSRNELESAIRNLRPSNNEEKRSKVNMNISKQKADLPQLLIHQEKESSNGTYLNKADSIPSTSDTVVRQWLPKADMTHIDPNVFIRHNHIGRFDMIFCRPGQCLLDNDLFFSNRIAEAYRFKR
jgi:hypothetical protein